MAKRVSDEARLLSAAEQELVAEASPAALEALAKPELQALAARLRNARDRAQRILAQQNREMRGKADPRGAAPARDNTGTAGKKTLLAEALARVNAALRKLEAARKKAAATEVLRHALEAKAASAPKHPDPGRTATKGMVPKASKQRTVRMDPREIGRVSQATKVAQAKRDR
jgi:glutamate/tyrosine decarboxylase-like PLP-dependent enzyme